MLRLIAKSPLWDHAPVERGGVSLSEHLLERVTSISMPAGDKAAAKALKSLGLTMPAPNSYVEKGTARLVWTGRNQAFLFGMAAPEGLVATDQSDGWAALRVTGAGADQVLMRHYPIDLRDSAFGVGRAVRAPLNHMSSILLRDSEGFLILVFRSMAKTAWHEVEAAMRAHAARAARPC